MHRLITFLFLLFRLKFDLQLRFFFDDLVSKVDFQLQFPLVRKLQRNIVAIFGLILYLFSEYLFVRIQGFAVEFVVNSQLDLYLVLEIFYLEEIQYYSQFGSFSFFPF